MIGAVAPVAPVEIINYARLTADAFASFPTVRKLKAVAQKIPFAIRVIAACPVVMRNRVEMTGVADLAARAPNVDNRRDPYSFFF